MNVREECSCMEKLHLCSMWAIIILHLGRMGYFRKEMRNRGLIKSILGVWHISSLDVTELWIFIIQNGFGFRRIPRNSGHCWLLFILALTFSYPYCDPLVPSAPTFFWPTPFLRLRPTIILGIWPVHCYFLIFSIDIALFPILPQLILQYFPFFPLGSPFSIHSHIDVIFLILPRIRSPHIMHSPILSPWFSTFLIVPF